MSQDEIFRILKNLKGKWMTSVEIHIALEKKINRSSVQRNLIKMVGFCGIERINDESAKYGFKYRYVENKLKKEYEKEFGGSQNV